MEMNEKDEIEGKESGINIVMHDFESVFPKDDPSVIGNFINSMSVGLWLILYAVIKPINPDRILKYFFNHCNEVFFGYFYFFQNMTIHICIERFITLFTNRLSSYA